MAVGDTMLRARVQGTWEGRALDEPAQVAFDGTQLVIRGDDDASAPVVIRVSELRGAVLGTEALVLHTGRSGVIGLAGSPHLEGLRHRLEAAVCVFPAQTLSLRGFGSERSAPGSDHDRWFEALLAARRVAEESRTVETQRRAFDAGRLGRHAQLVREAWATARFDEPADRRALEAELEELALPYATALRQLEHAALRLRQAPAEHQFETWRRWTGSVQRAFRTADEVWAATVPVLCDSRGAKGAFWRRFLGRADRRASS